VGVSWQWGAHTWQAGRQVITLSSSCSSSSSSWQQLSAITLVVAPCTDCFTTTQELGKL
jgi:hypothetical protein